MFKNFTVFQCHTPIGVGSQYFGGITYRFRGDYPETGIKEFLLSTSAKDKIYTAPFTFQRAISQAKQYGMKLIVNMNEVIREDIPLVCPDHFGKVAGIIADILQENGFTIDTAAITVINEPAERWHLNETEYLAYVNNADRYVNGRFKLIIINEEYHRFNEALIIPKLKNKSRFVWGVHHLSSLDNLMKNVWYAKTQANEFGVPIICNEGGSWFKDYQSQEGHEINVQLMKLCEGNNYLGFSLCLPEINQEGRKIFKLGYRIWNNDYTKIISQTNWSSFESEIKKYKKEGGEVPEDRLLKLVPGYMRGEDVLEVQNKLVELGFDITADSVYGPMTEVSIRKYQSLVGIGADGIVGKVTKAKLDEATIDNFYPEVFKNIYEKKDYSIEQIDYYLDSFAHPDLKGHGKYFKQAEEETGIPAEWLIANGAQESSYKGGGIGSSPIAQKYCNLFGWGVPDSGLTEEGKFGSFAECILYVAKRIKELFLDPDNWRYAGDSIFGIEKYYSTAPYNAIMKAKYYREICEFIDSGIKNKVPEYIEDLIPLLSEYFIRRD